MRWIIDPNPTRRKRRKRVELVRRRRYIKFLLNFIRTQKEIFAKSDAFEVASFASVMRARYELFSHILRIRATAESLTNMLKLEMSR